MDEDVRYIIGDSRKVLPTMKSESVNLMITSPPYWSAKNYQHKDQIGFGQPYNMYLEEMFKVLDESLRLLTPNGKMCINIQPLPVSKEVSGSDRSSVVDAMTDVNLHLRNIGMELSNIIIWDKRKYNNQQIFGSYPYPPNLYSHISFEYIYVFRKKGGSRAIKPEIKEMSKITMDEWKNWCFNSIWDIPPVIKFGTASDDVLSHVAPFPLEIPRRLIRMFSFAGDTVLDPFVGCGTTLGACKLEKRKGIGIELQGDYEPLIKLMLRNPSKIPTYKLAELLKKNDNLDNYPEAPLQ